MTKVLIGHHADSDGFCSFEIAKRAYKLANPNIFVKGIWLMRSAGQQKFLDAINPEDTVIILDFSLDVNTMKEIHAKVGGRFILIDHHRSCYNELLNAKVGFNGKVTTPDEPGAACFHTWKFFFNDKPMPKIVELISAFDTWSFSKDSSIIAPEIAIETGLTTVMSSMDFSEKDDLWDKLIFHNDETLIARLKMIGGLFVKDRMKFYDYLYKNSPVVEIENKKFKLVNIDNPIIFSYWTDCNTGNCEWPLLMYAQTSKGAIRFSVRACGHKLDCDKFCELFGGGGHELSAGFSLSWEEFMLFAEEYKFFNIPVPK